MYCLNLGTLYTKIERGICLYDQLACKAHTPTCTGLIDFLKLNGEKNTFHQSEILVLTNCFAVTFVMVLSVFDEVVLSFVFIFVWDAITFPLCFFFSVFGELMVGYLT